MMDTLRPSRATVTAERPALSEPKLSSIGSAPACCSKRPAPSSSASRSEIWSLADEVATWATSRRP